MTPLLECQKIELFLNQDAPFSPSLKMSKLFFFFSTYHFKENKDVLPKARYGKNVFHMQNLSN